MAKPKRITPAARLARMQRSFARDYSILEEDYRYFRTHDILEATERAVCQATG